MDQNIIWIHNSVLWTDSISQNFPYIRSLHYAFIIFLWLYYIGMNAWMSL